MGELDLQLQRLLQSCGLEHLAFYDRDRATMFVTENPRPPKELSAEPSSSGLERAGRQLFYILEELAPDFAELRSGALIRTVVRVPMGALLYQSVGAGFHLCCATPQDRVTELIARMTESIDDLRPTVRYSLLPRRSYLSRCMPVTPPTAKPPAAGGVTERVTKRVDVIEGSSYTVDSATTGSTAVTGGSATTRGPAITKSPAITGDSATTEDSATTVGSAARTPAELSDLLRAALGIDGLHYVAYYAAGVPACTVDIFRHRALSTHFGASVTPQQRRDKYSLLGRLLPGVTRRMNTSLQALLEGRIHQIVLNVEQGAVYFQHLGEDQYLLGVSLDHSRLAEADRHIERLVAALACE
ncbi:hypothetical protein [Streptomyces coeruleorubidus]|uniref:hypothetical protein n=1 Tax=Streptomyces coeruleorubidus TaxID=116188 RepID=UPI0037B2A447